MVDTPWPWCRACGLPVGQAEHALIAVSVPVRAAHRAEVLGAAGQAVQVAPGLHGVEGRA